MDRFVLAKFLLVPYTVISMDGMRHLAACASSWSAATAAGQRDGSQRSVDMGSVL